MHHWGVYGGTVCPCCSLAAKLDVFRYVAWFCHIISVCHASLQECRFDWSIWFHPKYQNHPHEKFVKTDAKENVFDFSTLFFLSFRWVSRPKVSSTANLAYSWNGTRCCGNFGIYGVVFAHHFHFHLLVNWNPLWFKSENYERFTSLWTYCNYICVMCLIYVVFSLHLLDFDGISWCRFSGGKRLLEGPDGRRHREGLSPCWVA